MAIEKWEAANRLPNNGEELKNIIDKDFQEVRNYFDNLGLLIYIGIIDKALIIDHVGDTAAEVWKNRELSLMRKGHAELQSRRTSIITFTLNI